MRQVVIAVGLVVTVLVSLAQWSANASAAMPVACTPTPDGRLSPYWFSGVARWEKLVVLYATRAGLDPDLVASVMRHESAGDPETVSEAGAVGLMQIMPLEAGFTWRPSTTALRDPAINIYRGTQILSQVIGDAKGDLRSALGAYNGGWGGYAHKTPQDYAGWVLADYARALAARNCWPEPSGFALITQRGTGQPEIIAESGCRIYLVNAAYKSSQMSVYPALISCDLAAHQPDRDRTGRRSEVER